MVLKETRPSKPVNLVSRKGKKSSQNSTDYNDNVLEGDTHINIGRYVLEGDIHINIGRYVLGVGRNKVVSEINSHHSLVQDG